MNCKQGDLAVIVRSYAGNEGKIVQCLRFVPNWIRIGADGWECCGPAWEVDRTLPKMTGWRSNIIADSQLRPLRDNDGEDEMLRLVGLPVGTPQAA